MAENTIGVLAVLANEADPILGTDEAILATMTDLVMERETTIKELSPEVIEFKAVEETKVLEHSVPNQVKEAKGTDFEQQLN